MEQFASLETYLKSQCVEADLLPAVSTTILAIAAASTKIANLVAFGPLAGEMSEARGDNSDGDVQKELDLVSNDLIIDALREAPVAFLVSEELDQAMLMNEGAPLFVATDPLDGSSNIETNAAVGTIFSIYAATALADTSLENVVLQAGTQQLAAGYCIYGPQTALVLTVGTGTQIFTLDPVLGDFRLTTRDVQIAETTREFAINVSNFRHWDPNVRAYIDDCLDGEAGVRRSKYNMRWVASLVAECHRILSRGGIFLYPGDDRKGYAHGRLRLVYECNAIAFLIEEAGGGATDGRHRILDLQPTSIHQRVPMVFGSLREIQRVERYYANQNMTAQKSQLFGKRGLLRA